MNAIRARTDRRFQRRSVGQDREDLTTLARVGLGHRQHVAGFLRAGGCIDFGRFRWIPTRISETDRCRKGVPSNVPLLVIIAATRFQHEKRACGILDRHVVKQNTENSLARPVYEADLSIRSTARSPQHLVDQRQKLLCGLSIALLDSRQDFRNVAHGGEVRSPVCVGTHRIIAAAIRPCLLPSLPRKP